jgi:hypothetical protein
MGIISGSTTTTKELREIDTPEKSFFAGRVAENTS